MSEKQSVMEMVQEFYKSDAVDHPVELSTLEETFWNAASCNPMIRGVILEEKGEIVGYAYLTFYFASEVGGINLMLEEIFIKEQFRGRGYGRKFFEWLFEEYPNVKRYRLEVTRTNKNAAALYQKMGFEFLEYGQMIRDI